MLGFPPPDHLSSVLVSTKKGGENKYNNAYRRISANVVSPSGAHARPHTALMHNMDREPQYYGGKNHEASDPDSTGGYFLLAVVSIAGAQQALQPVYRLGNFLEVGNDVFMHIIATTDIRDTTVPKQALLHNVL